EVQTLWCETCASSAGNPFEPNPDDGDPDELVDDPTSAWHITVRMRSVYEQTLSGFPESTWACWSERPGSKSEHPLGRACDVAFGDTISGWPDPATHVDG